MKKVLAVLLSVVMFVSCASVSFAASEEDSDFGAYKSVVIIGIDGAGAFVDNADTPNMDRIFAENSFVSNNALAENQTSSAQNWMSILSGVAFEDHGIYNEIADVVERTSNEKYPTIFRTVRENKPDAKLASFCHWNSINIGIIENDVDVYKDTGSDEEVCNKIVDYLGNNTPDVLFAQFDDIDHVGHEQGFGCKAFLDKITLTDEYVGRVYDAIEQKGALDDTLFIVVADHGGTRLGGHGGFTLGERYVFVGVKGKTVGENNTYRVRNRDVAAIALYALGIEQNPEMAATVPNGLFTGNTNEPATFWDEICVFFETAIMYLTNIFADIGGKF